MLKKHAFLEGGRFLLKCLYAFMKISKGPIGFACSKKNRLLHHTVKKKPENMTLIKLKSQLSWSKNISRKDLIAF